MQAQLWELLALLADGQNHHVRSLAQLLNQKPARLNAAWQHVPAHLRGLLRQQDGFWRLVRPLAMLPTPVAKAVAAEYGLTASVVPECDSSNNELLMLAKQSAASVHGQLCLTYQQHAGRGRQGRQWISRSGECLMLSVAWSFDLPQAQLGGLALAVALAIQQSLADNHIHVHIKWPNDLVVGTDKLGGVLIETVRQGGQTVAVIGIGLNFVLPKSVPHATSVQALNSQVGTLAVYRRLLFHLCACLEQYNRQGFAPFQAAYEAVHRDQNQVVHLLHHQAVQAVGTVLGVTSDGRLRLATDTGEQHIVSGEISLRQGQHMPTPLASTRPAQGSYLLLDGGNSKLKWAWAHHGQLEHSGKAAYADLSALAQDWVQHGGDTVRIVGSAVCGSAKQALVAAELPLPIEWLGAMPHALGIRNHYRNPAEQGADRWFNILGSRRFSAHACVVVSCGTAVTVDALTDNHHYLGGSILPGLFLMKEAMAQHTANLNRPLGKAYPFATTTPNALASGIMDAICGAIMLMHHRLQTKVGKDKPVDIIITGGGAAKVGQTLSMQIDLDIRIEIVDNLVIHGLLNWIEPT